EQAATPEELAPSAQGSGELPPWEQAAAAEEAAQPAPANFGDLPPWAQENAAPAEEIGGGSPFDEPATPEIDWGQALGETAATQGTGQPGASLTGELPWQQEELGTGTPGPSAAGSQDAWLMDFGTPDIPDEQPAPVSQGNPSDSLDWLNDSPEEPVQEAASF